MSPGDESAKGVAATATAAPGPAPPKPNRQQLREAMMRAANRLENSPCDRQLKPPLRAAILAYLEEVRLSRNGLDQEVGTVILGAANVGVITPAEIGGVASTTGTVVVNTDGSRITILYDNPFTCDIGGADEDDARR